MMRRTGELPREGTDRASVRDARRAVSQEGSDLLQRTRRAYAALNRRDFDAVIEIFGPDSVWDVSRWGLGAHAGPEAIRRFLGDWFGSLEEYEVEIEEMLDLGSGVIYAIVVQTARRAGSQRHLRLRSAPVFVWVDGVVARLTLYPDIDEGHAAAEREGAGRHRRSHLSGRCPKMRRTGWPAGP